MSDDKVLAPRKLLIEAMRAIDQVGVQDHLANYDLVFKVKNAIGMLLAQPSDGALANEGAGPVAWTYKEYVWASGIQHHLWRDQLEREQPEASRNIKDLEPLYRHPPKVCTCPSGDGSLRWPCPVHPPEVKVVLPERKQIDPYSYDQGGNSKAEGWNACLDRVKELNS